MEEEDTLDMSKVAPENRVPEGFAYPGLNKWAREQGYIDEDGNLTFNGQEENTEDNDQIQSAA